MLFALLPLLACRGSDEPLPVRFTEVRRFGCEDCSGAEQFSRIQGMSVDADGGVYVADLYPPFVRVWASDGSLAAFVGQEGQGPAEFQRVAYVFPAPGGGFSAVDNRQHRWVLFGAREDYLRTIALPRRMTMPSYSAAEQALYMAVQTRSETGLRGTEIRRLPLGPEGEPTVVAEIANAPPAKSSGAPAILYNLAIIPAGGFGIAYGFDEYLLSAFDATGSPRYELTHDVARVARTAEELAAEGERLRRIAGSLAPAPDPLRPHFLGNSLRYDDAGRTWLLTERGMEGNTIFDIFSPAGEYEGEFSMPLQVKSRGIGFDLAGEYMVTIHAEGDSDTQFVTLWRVSWDE